MSTCRECHVIEYQPGIWYYLLEQACSPAGAFDWRENAQAWGPFISHEQAQTHLFNNHPNPGHHLLRPFKADRKPDQILDQLIKDAFRPAR